jgi:hypothetical protein
LRKHGGKRAWELGPEYPCDNIEQPGFYDLINVYNEGFTPDTQPHREHWAVLYELAKYPPGWERALLERDLIPWYEIGQFKPCVEVLQSWTELGEELGKRSEDGWIRAIFAETLIHVEVKMKEGKIVECRDVDAVG